MTNNLQRIRELAVQFANATNSASDRTALQAEVAQLEAEIDRVAQNTKFNGVALLDGTFTSQAFQIGADITDTVSISSIESARTSAIGGTFSATATGAAVVDANAIVATSGDANALVINDTLIGASTSDGVSTTGDTYSALSKANAINALSSTTGVTATASTTLSGTVAASGNAASSFTLNNVLVSWDNSDGTASNNAAALDGFECAHFSNRCDGRSLGCYNYPNRSGWSQYLYCEQLQRYGCCGQRPGRRYNDSWFANVNEWRFGRYPSREHCRRRSCSMPYRALRPTTQPQRLAAV